MGQWPPALGDQTKKKGKTMNSEASLSAAIKADHRVKPLDEISGGRLLIEIAVKDIHVHPDLKQIRAADPTDVSTLTRSIKETAGQPLYPLLLFVVIGDDGQPTFYIADGHQRLRGLVENAVEKTIGIVVLRWRTVNDAMADGLGANFARFKCEGRYPVDHPQWQNQHLEAA
jgi:hypothetical protein